MMLEWTKKVLLLCLFVSIAVSNAQNATTAEPKAELETLGSSRTESKTNSSDSLVLRPREAKFDKPAVPVYRVTPAPKPVPAYSQPDPLPASSYSVPAPAPASSYSVPDPKLAPAYSAPAPASSYSVPDPKPAPAYSAPAPASSYSVPDPKPAPAYSAPAPASSYSVPDPKPAPAYSAPAPASSYSVSDPKPAPVYSVPDPKPVPVYFPPAPKLAPVYSAPATAPASSYSVPDPKPAPYAVPKPAPKPTPAPVPVYGVPISSYSPPEPVPVPSYGYSAPAAPQKPKEVPAPAYSAPAPVYSVPNMPVPAYPSDPVPAPAYPSDPAPAPAYGSATDADQSTYYYYYPVEEKQSPWEKILNLLRLDSWLNPEKFHGWPSDTKLGLIIGDDQKTWLAVLVPLIIVAVGIPLLGLVLSAISPVSVGRALSDYGVSYDSVREGAHELFLKYATNIDTEECIERFICNVGGYAHTIPARSVVISFMEQIIPDEMKEKMRIFKKAVLYGWDKAKCNSFKCSKMFKAKQH